MGGINRFGTAHDSSSRSVVVSGRLSGFRAWALQRVSALYIVFYLAVSLFCLVYYGLPDNYADWRALFAGSIFNLATMALFLALLIHAWVGARDIVIDYVHLDGWRFSLLVLLALMLVGTGLWVLRLLIGVLMVGGV